MSPGERPLRLLSLDGGGIRGLSIIYILQELMRRVNRGRSHDDKLEPWQYFDMIGGTSTGGIIAIMLGPLKMTLDECEQEYRSLGKQIFTPKWRMNLWKRGHGFLKAEGKFDDKILEDAVKTVIAGRLESSDAKLLRDAGTECKVFVCAIYSSRTGAAPVRLRTYENEEAGDLFSKLFKLWEACRATSAASTFFDPFELRDGSETWKFIDGALMYNNPVWNVLNEARDVWGSERPMHLISIGTGEASMMKQLDGDIGTLAKGVIALATDAGNTAEDFHDSNRDLARQGRYFRFNVPCLDQIELDEHSRSSEIRGATQSYLNKRETKGKFEQCVEGLLETERQGEHMNELLRMNPLRDEDMDMIKTFTRTLYQRCSDYERERHRVPLHAGATCEWFLGIPKFVQWRQSTEESALWVTAEAGCGKSVLAKFLIGQLLSDKHQVIHFFFRHFRYDNNDLLCALLHQLLVLLIPSTEAKSSKMLRILFDELEFKGDKVMHEDETIWNMICNATTESQHTSSKLYCVIDGLDECPEQPRSEFINLIVSTFSVSGTTHKPPNILITSRPYPVIETCFRQVSRIRLRLENATSEISKDIESVITDKIQKLDSTRYPPETQKSLHTRISQKAGRTFLWVSLIFEALEELDSTTNGETCKILESNPEKLNMLYEDSLSGTKDKDKTRRLLQILIAATRPLTLDELNVALQIRKTSKFYEDIDLEPDIEGVIKRLCGSVIRITNSTVDFMHQTARDFLTASQSTLEPSEGKLTWGASINVDHSHSVLGSICLWYLALSDWDELGARWDDTRFTIPRCSRDTLNKCMKRNGCLCRRMGDGSSSEGGHRTGFAPFTSEDLDRIRAEVETRFRFYDYAGKNWAFHCEEVLKDAEFDFDPQLQASLTTFRETGIGRIRRCTGTSKDPFVFLQEKGFRSVVRRLLDGQRIQGYTDDQLLEALCVALEDGKGKFVWPLLQYSTTITGASKQHSTTETNEWYSRVANSAARKNQVSIIEYLEQKAEITFDETALSRGLSETCVYDRPSVVRLIGWGAKDYHARFLLKWLEQELDLWMKFPDSTRFLRRHRKIPLLLLQTQDYRNMPKQFTQIFPPMFFLYPFYQKSQGAKQTKIFELFLRQLLDLPLDSYIYAILEAIKWRHPCVGYLIRSRVDLICATNEHPGPYTPVGCSLNDVFSVACRYGGLAASLLCEFSYPAIDVNRRDALGVTPLIAAILAGDYPLCKCLLRLGANANAYVFHKAEGDAVGDEDWVVPHCPDKPKEISFMRVQKRDLVMRDWAWTRLHPRIPDISGRYGCESFNGCPLTEALRVHNLRIFSLLLKHGGDPSQDHSTGISVFAAAASYSEVFFDQFVDLVRASENVNSFDIDKPEKHSGRTILHTAARSGFWNSVIKLVLEGATVNIADVRKWTPLHEISSLAPKTGRFEMFKKLVEDHGADVKATNIDGKTPLDLLEESLPTLVASRKQTQDEIQTYAFLRESKNAKNCHMDSSNPEVELEWEVSSAELDLESEPEDDVVQDAMSNVRSESGESSNAADDLDSEKLSTKKSSTSLSLEARISPQDRRYGFLDATRTHHAFGKGIVYFLCLLFAVHWIRC